MFDITLNAILFLSVTAYGVNVLPHTFELKFFQIAVAVLFCLSLFSKKVREIGRKEAGFAAFIMIGAFIGVVRNNFGAIYIGTYMQLFLCVIFGVLVYQYCRAPKKCFSWVMWGVFVNLGIMLLQRAAGIEVFIPTQYQGISVPDEAGGMIGSLPRLAMMLTLITPFMPYGVALFFVAFCCWVKEFTILIPCAAAVTFLFKPGRKKIIFLCLCGSVAVYFKKYLFYALSLRWELWKPAIYAILKNPLGAGVGMYPSLCSGVLQVTYMIGFYVSLVGFAYIFKEIYRNFKVNRETVGVISILSLMAFEYALEIVRFWPVIITIIAVYFIKQEEVNHVSSICP